MSINDQLLATIADACPNAREIRYSLTPRDYDAFFDGRYIGSYTTHHDAEYALNALVGQNPQRSRRETGDCPAADGRRGNRIFGQADAWHVSDALAGRCRGTEPVPKDDRYVRATDPALHRPSHWRSAAAAPDRAAIQTLIAGLTRAGRASDTVRMVRTVLCAALDQAIAYGLIERNPATGTRPPHRAKWSY